MKRGVWVGGLVLSLGGWASDLLAEDGAWRPAKPGPTPAALGPSELKPCPAASIGRPIPLDDGATGDGQIRLPDPKPEETAAVLTTGAPPSSLDRAT